MILTFKPNFLSGRPTNFVEKIWASKTSPKAFHTMSMMDAMYEDIEAIPASKTGRYKPEFCIDDLRPKLHTIRKDEKNRWKGGKIIHFTLFNRTKDHWNFFTTKCTGVQRVFMVIYPRSGELNDKNLIYLVIPDKTGLSLKDKQELVGGYIDVVSGHTEYNEYNSKDPIFVINDEGKFVDDHYVNTFPTLFGRKNRYICNDDYFAGPVLCMTSESMK
jgi:hypothetical protein